MILATLCCIEIHRNKVKEKTYLEFDDELQFKSTIKPKVTKVNDNAPDALNKDLYCQNYCSELKYFNLKAPLSNLFTNFDQECVVLLNNMS